MLLNQFYLTTNGYNLEQRKEFCRRLEEQMTAAPGVTDVAYSDGVPLGFEPSWWEDLRIEGYAPPPGENMKIFRNVISPGYLPLMHIPIVEGRNFTEARQRDKNSPPVMIVNQAFVRRFFAGRDPIGRKIHGWGEWFRVVGVAQDSKYHYLGESAPPYFYVPFRQVYREDMNLAFYVRTHGDPDRRALRRCAPQVRAHRSQRDRLRRRAAEGVHRRIALSAKNGGQPHGGAGRIAVLLAAVGLYSVMAYSVAQRTQEIGVRMALGAQPRPCAAHGGAPRPRAHRQRPGRRHCPRHGPRTRHRAALSVTNSAMGKGAQLAGGTAANPLIYIGAVVFLAAIAALAAFVPAHRAASIDPMQALRSE